MKRLFALIIAFAITLPLIMTPVLAAASTDNAEKSVVSFTLDKVAAEPDTDVDVSLRIDGDYSANCMTIFVDYDESLISPVGNAAQGTVWNSILANSGSVSQGFSIVTTGRYGFIAIMPEGAINATGVLFTLKFHISPDAERGTTIPVALTISQFTYDETNGSSFPISFSSENGEILVALEYYTITYTVNGDEYTTQTNRFGSTVTPPEYTVPEGYSFTGWDVPATMPAEDLVLDALLTINSYTVTYTINGEEYSTQTYEYGAAIVPPSYTVPLEHTFSGWDIPETMPAADITVDATLTLITYTITYTINGEEYATQTYGYGCEISVPPYTAPVGYTFSGWTVPATMPSGDFTVDATLTVNSYTITYTINGETYAVESYEYGTAVTAPAYSVPEGHTFSGWTVPATMPAEDLVLDAALTVNSYTITYTINGENYIVQTYEYGTAITAPDYAVPEGHTFSCWELPETMPAEDITVDATLTVNSYTITYTVNDEFYCDQTYEYGAPVIAPEYETPEGHTFSGWDVPETMPAEDITVDAFLTVNTYTIAYTINGEEYAVQTYEYGAAVNAPEFVCPEGHTFSGWNVPATMPAQNLTLDATLTVNSYTIIYTINGATYTTQTYEYGATVTAPAYTVPEGHTFSGWNVPATMPAQNLTLNATLTVNTYTVTFVDGFNGEVIAEVTVEYGADAEPPEVPEHSWRYFVGWSGSFTNVTHDTTVTAEYGLLGDINHSNTVDVTDALMALRYSMGLIDIEEIAVGDIDRNGTINVTDALMILRHAMGLI